MATPSSPPDTSTTTNDDRTVTVAPSMGGSLHVDEAATNAIIRAAALSVPGCVERSAGIGHLTGKTLPQSDILTDGPYITAEVHIAVSWPSPVVEVARTVRDTVIRHLEAYLITSVTHVDIIVDSVTTHPAPGSKARPERVVYNDLVAFDSTPELRHVTAPCDSAKRADS